MNKAELIGNLTKKPELKTTQSGVNVCSFSIAVNRRYADKNGEKVTDFFNIIAWRQLAELCCKYLDKGHKVGVIGELQTRSYEAKDGTKRYVTEIVADTVDFLTPKSGNASGEGGADDYPEPSFPQDENGGFQTVADDDELPF